MIRIILALFTLGALVVSGPVAARDGAGEVYHRAVPAALNADAAYLLLRSSKAKTGLFPIQHVLLRIPTRQELEAYRIAKKAAYEAALPNLTKAAKDGKVVSLDEFQFNYTGPANSFVVQSGKFLEDRGDMRTVLIELPPGSYIIYGSTMGGGGLVTCNCLGTVRFDVKPGVVTDIGSLYVDKVHKPSPVPNLEDDLGEQMFQYGLILGQALRPAGPETPVPAGLRALTIEAAQFDVVGQYYEPGAAGINRLAPIPGLLGYERGRPVDLRTGKLAR